MSKCLYSIDEVYSHAPDVCMQSHFLSVVYSCVLFACFDVTGILISSTKITTFVEFQYINLYWYVQVHVLNIWSTNEV